VTKRRTATIDVLAGIGPTRTTSPGRTVTHAYASPGTDDASSRWLFPEVDGDA
jgi:hypothetical protein